MIKYLVCFIVLYCSSAACASYKTPDDIVDLPCLTKAAKTTIILNNDWTFGMLFNANDSKTKTIKEVVDKWVKESKSSAFLKLPASDQAQITGALANLKKASDTLTAKEDVPYRDFFVFNKEADPSKHVQAVIKMLREADKLKSSEIDHEDLFDVPLLHLKSINKRQDVEDAFKDIAALVNKTFLFVYTDGVPGNSTTDELVRQAKALGDLNLARKKHIYEDCDIISGNKRPSPLPPIPPVRPGATVKLSGGSELCCHKPERVCTGDRALGCITGSNGINCTLITNYCS